MWDWIWQNLVSSILWEILLIIGGAAALGYVKRKLPEHAPTVVYSLLGATCIAILIFTFTGQAIFSKPKVHVEPKNAEESVRKWADSAGLSTTKMPSAPDREWGLIVGLKSGNPVQVFIAKDNPGFLQIQSPLTLAPEHIAMLNKLSKQEADDALEEILFDLNRARIGFVIMTMGDAQSKTTTGPAIAQQSIVVTRPMAFSGEIDEASFLHDLDTVDSDIGIVRGTTDLTLKRYTRNPRPIRPHLTSR